MRAEEQSSWEAGEPTLTAHATGAMDAPSIHLDVGTRVGRFIVRRPIGAGGMGSVYLAHDPDLDRLVALKLLHADTGDAAARERLLREAKATARLSHPNVVAVYDVGAHGDASFIAL
ncbi:MAG TPA: protein kinase, partial [Nannocystaceae bacterium]|nr:protein kinase [Nannocystaceae bacterium]